MKGLTLIGMPGAGKSTIGKILADRLNFDFIDLDLLIKEKEGVGHEVILQNRGEAEFLRLEEQYALELNYTKVVFSPGGSIIYSEPTMNKLKKESIIFYLELPFKKIKQRLGPQTEQRGIVGLKKKGLAALYNERASLYCAWAHHTLKCANSSQDAIVKKILELYLNKGRRSSLRNTFRCYIKSP